MPPPAAPQDSDRERVAVLRRYAILDTPPEPEFDELVARAARETGYPTALFSLMDSNRCWFKASTGLQPEDAHLHELPRDETFCNYAFRSSGTFVVRDAPADDRFARLVVVNRPAGYRAYAGAQIITDDGHSLGTLCVLDQQSRAPNAAEQAALRRLADEAMALLEARRQRLASRPATTHQPLAIVADDEPIVRAVAAEMLRFLGFEVLEADNGSSALDLCRTHGAAVQLVLTDFNMPRVDGLTLARTLRAGPKPPTIILMSGRFDDRVRPAVLESGVSSILRKPFTLDALRAAAVPSGR